MKYSDLLFRWKVKITHYKRNPLQVTVVPSKFYCSSILSLVHKYKYRQIISKIYLSVLTVSIKEKEYFKKLKYLSKVQVL